MGQKTDCFWQLITLRRLMGERYVMSTVSEFCIERLKYKNCMLVHLNILGLIWINLRCMWNYAKFAKKHGYYPIFNSQDLNELCLCCWNKNYCQTFTVCRKTTYFFVFHQNGTLYSTPFMLHCFSIYSCAKVHWARKLASNSLDLNPVDYSVWIALQQMVYRH